MTSAKETVEEVWSLTTPKGRSRSESAESHQYHCYRFYELLGVASYNMGCNSTFEGTEKFRDNDLKYFLLEDPACPAYSHSSLLSLTGSETTQLAGGSAVRTRRQAGQREVWTS